SFKYSSQLLLNSNSTKGLNSNTPSKLEIFLKGISFFEFLFKFISTPPYKGYNYFHYIYNIKVKDGQHFFIHFLLYIFKYSDYLQVTYINVYKIIYSYRFSITNNKM